MSPKGHEIMRFKRMRAYASVDGNRNKFWGLTLHINLTARRP